MNIKKSIAGWLSTFKTAKREALLYPNKGSQVKVEEYELPLTQSLLFGHREFYFPSLYTTPQTIFSPKRMTCNVAWPGVIFITDIKVANVSASVTNYIVDAFTYNPQSNQRMHLPTMNPQTAISVSGFYPGAVPTGYREDEEFFFCCTFHGYAELAGK